ncbi:MAG: hypothetical protein GXN98_02905 [Euryarchaeota archaeon]|nr:hypothetical protein [Euryarchaeota archaeon]
MAVILILYALLFLSVLFNVLLLFRIKYLRDDIIEIRRSVELSQEELEQLKSRLMRIKEEMSGY